MKKEKDNGNRRMKVVLSAIGSFAAVTMTTSFLVTQYSDADLWSHSRSAFTEAEKATMFQRSTPPQAAIDAMRRVGRSKSATPSAKLVSPWAKPQP